MSFSMAAAEIATPLIDSRILESAAQGITTQTEIPSSLYRVHVADQAILTIIIGSMDIMA